MYGFKNMFKFGFHFKAFDVRNKHHFYENYINDIEQRLISDKEELQKAYDSAMASANDEEQEYRVDDYYQDLWQEAYEFNPSLLYGSVFLSLFGFLEGTMKHLYEECVTPHGFNYPPIKGSKKALIHYKGFFTTNKLFDFTPYKDQFKFLEDCTKIRDKIIHTNGEMTEEELDGIKPVLSQYSSISIKAIGFGIVDKVLVLQLNDTIKSVLEPLCNFLYNNIEEYNPSSSSTIA